MNTVRQVRWYDAELARMQLHAANANRAVAASTPPGDAYWMTVVCLTGLGLLALADLLL